MDWSALRWEDAIQLGLFLVAFAGWLGIRGYSVFRSATRGGRWREAARKAGFGRLKWSGDDLVGRAGPLSVRFSRYGDTQTRITVSGLGTAAGLTLRIEGDARAGGTGDDAFDAAVLAGPPALAQAVLEPAARREILSLHADPAGTPGPAGWSLKDGALRIDVADLEPSQVSVIVEEVIRVVGSLAEPADVARRIADNIKIEPVPGVRARSLDVLLREYPDDRVTREALAAARRDPAAEVRLRAGLALGAEGRDLVRAVAADEGAPDDTAERAFAALEPELALDEVIGLLRCALRTRRIRTAEACIASLGRRGGLEAVAFLSRVLAVEAGELGGAATRALAATGDPAVEPPLLRALAEGPPELQLAAATVLGRVGTAAAVVPLREAETSDGEIRSAARQAIAEIQSRLTGAEAGQLSLAGGEAGQLSLAEGEAGRLSLSMDPSRSGLQEFPQEDTSGPSGPGRRAPSRTTG